MSKTGSNKQTISYFGHIYEGDTKDGYAVCSHCGAVENSNKAARTCSRLLPSQENEQFVLKGETPDLITALRTQLAAHRWIPVGERLPEVPLGPPNESSKLVWLIHKGKAEQGHYTNFAGWRIWGSYFNKNTVQTKITHWKPIILPKGE